MWKVRNLDFKSSEYKRSVSTICSCNGTCQYQKVKRKLDQLGIE